jgi:uncharacterized protein YdaU (DUF1376 family)
MKGFPYFPFYASDWVGSTKIALMSPEQEGAYIRLLCHAWADPDCGLPDDDNALAALSRVGQPRWREVSDRVRACFSPHPTVSGKIHNTRLSEIRAEYEGYREAQRGNSAKRWRSRGNPTAIPPHSHGNPVGVPSVSLPPPPPPPQGGGESPVEREDAAACAAGHPQEGKEGEVHHPTKSEASAFMDALRAALPAGTTVVKKPSAEFGPRQEVVRQLCVVAVRTTKMPNKGETIRQTLEGMVARYGAQAIEAWLMDPKNIGKNVNEMQDDLRPRPANGSRVFRSTAKDPCRNCGGDGKLLAGIDSAGVKRFETCHVCQKKKAKA